MIEPENLFEASAESLYSTTGSHAGRVGFKIPEYQRTYDWKAENIKRLLEDCLGGFANCWASRAPSYTFLGTIILVNEKSTKERTFTGTSLVVVDGQQRLTTLSLLCCVLIEGLLRHQDDVQQLKAPTKQWLQDELEFQMDSLFDCVVGRLPQRGKDFPFPRIVRGGELDTRASNFRDKDYRSVVGKCFWEFARFYTDGLSQFEPTRDKEKVESRRLFENYDYIKDQINLALINTADHKDRYKLNFERDGHDQFNTAGVRRLFEKLHSGEKDAHRALADVENTPSAVPLVRLVAFSSYVTNCVILTRVETEDDSYAFDIFDALNTTGEPLTAVETLRPRIVQFEERNEGFRNSPSHTHLESLKEYIDQIYVNNDARQKETKELLVSFAQYFDAEKLGFPLNAQRTYLRNRFDAYDRDRKAVEHRRRFVKGIADMAEFRYRFWDPDRIKRQDILSQFPPMADQLKLCFSFIRAMNTSLALPLLARYWTSWCDGESSDEELVSVTKAITAFIVLRRAATGGTAGIDSEFRRMMRDRLGAGGDPLCTGTSWSNRLPNPESLKAELINRYLSSMIYDADGNLMWVKRAASQSLASYSRPLCRFLLLAAAHNARPDPAMPGLLTRAGVIPAEELDYLSFARWTSDLYETVEHVAPDSDTNRRWDSTIYSDGAKDTLGNLVLLPTKENSSIGNAAWTKKKSFYRALSARTRDDREKAADEANANGLSFGKRVESLLSSNERMRMLEGLDEVPTWDRSFIELRATRLAELAWEEIYGWLQPSE